MVGPLVDKCVFGLVSGSKQVTLVVEGIVEVFVVLALSGVGEAGIDEEGEQFGGDPGFVMVGQGHHDVCQFKVVSHS